MAGRHRENTVIRAGLSYHSAFQVRALFRRYIRIFKVKYN